MDHVIRWGELEVYELEYLFIDPVYIGLEDKHCQY